MALAQDEPLSFPSHVGSFLVFSQSNEASVDIDSWTAHANRFFATRIGLAAIAPPSWSFVIAPERESSAIRSAHVRPRAEEDLALADAADTAGTGLARLARRCPMVWLVAREASDDRVALRLATILASILLGPILDAQVPELLGVKSARARLDAPYKVRS
jgi:hypothetical protein